MTRISKSTANIVACIVTALLLCFLFIFPSRLMSSVRDDVSSHVDGIISSVRSDDWDAALRGANAIEARFSSVSDTLRLFLDHEDLDELEAVIVGSIRLIEQHDDKQLLFELEHIRNIVKYLAAIDTFTIPNLF